MAQETEAIRRWEGADLIGGEDEDFVINLYLAVLGRPPDAAGYRHYREFVAGNPERWMEALRAVASSEEARKAGDRVAFTGGPAIPPGPSRASQVSLAVFRAWAIAALDRHEEAIGMLGGAGFAAELIESRDAALHYEMAALRREVAERLDGLLGPVAGETAAARDAAITALSRLVADHVGDRVAALEAQYEQRFRALEARLLALEARRGP